MADRAKHKVSLLRFASVGMTELFRYGGDGRVVSLRRKLLWQCRLPPLHNAKMGRPRLVWVGKNLVQRSFVGSLRLCRKLRCLRMTSTSPPFFSVSSCAMTRNTRSLHCASLRPGLTELFSLRGDDRVFSAHWESLWQCRLPPLHRTQRWGTPRFGLGGKERGAEILRWESPALPETPLPQDDTVEWVGHSFVYLLSLGGGT